MATPSRDRQASPACSEGTQTRHLPVWTCPDPDDPSGLLAALGKSHRFTAQIIPFLAPQTTFKTLSPARSPLSLAPPKSATPATKYNLPPSSFSAPATILARNSRLCHRTARTLEPRPVTLRNRTLGYRLSPTSAAQALSLSNLYTTSQPPSHPSLHPPIIPTPLPKQAPLSPSHLKCALLNTWSLNNHALDIRDLITTNNLDLLALTETWLTDACGPTIEAAVPNGYSIKYANRTSARGGGVALIHRSDIPLFPAPIEPCNNCESTLLKLAFNPTHCLNLLLIYRPPQDMPEFNSELLQCITPLLKSHTSTILLGDLNLGRGDPNDKRAIALEEDLLSLNFPVLNSKPTHRKGRTLDWIAAHQCSVQIDSTLDCIWSDHHVIHFTVNLPEPPLPPPNPPLTLTLRNLKKLSPSILSNAIDAILQSTSDTDHPDTIVASFQQHMTTTLNAHAPLTAKKIRLTKKAAKWFSDSLRETLSLKRHAEKRWLKSQLEQDKASWRTIATRYKQEIALAKKYYYQNRIDSANNKSKELFTVLHELEKPLMDPPTFSPSNSDCTKVQTFFADKVNKARDRISSRKANQNNTRPSQQAPDASVPTPPSQNHAPSCHDSMTPPTPTAHSLFHLEAVTADTTCKVLKSMKPSPDKCDFFPSKVILKYPELFAPLLTRIINSSFAHSSIPSSLKIVTITPIPKKPKADLKDPSNLRPITNVMFLLKLLDKIATAQFQLFVDSNNLLHHRQSGFRKGFSTETALLDLHIKLRNMIEESKAGLLVLLDLSAAFDLIDHNTLISRLSSEFNCSPSACSWIHSFLSERKSKVTWGEAESPTETLLFGVPQGSCLSPALFNTYLRPLFSLLEEQGVVFTNYADDTQILLELTGDYAQDSCLLQSTYATILSWMDDNWMCLNGSKTELLVVSSKDKRAKLGPTYEHFHLDNSTIKVATQVKTLGVILDAHLTMTPHINAIIKSTQYHLRLLRAIRPLISEPHCASIARATIMPRIDYCNSLLTNTIKSNTHKLQVIQNSAVRIVSQVPKRDHISEAREALHWLHVSARVEYKILTITHKCLHDSAPSYLSSVISRAHYSRSLRSSSAGFVTCPRANKKCGNRSSFSFTAPSAWNKLPRQLRLEENFTTFKKQLKTLLFN